MSRKFRPYTFKAVLRRPTFGDEPGGGQAAAAGQGAPAGGTEGTPPPAPASTASAAPAGAAAPASAGAGVGAGAGAGTSTDWQSARDFAKQHGLDVSRYNDDASFLQALIAEQQQAGQLRQLAQYGQTYLQHATDFERWRQEQAAAAQKKAEADKPKWWNPPEWNPAWAQLVHQDEQGNFQLRPGAPPDVLPKYLAHQQYRRDFADRLLTDPVSTLKPFVEDVARQIAEQQAQGMVQQYGDRQFVDSFVAQHSGWLHQKDAQGQTLRNAQGQPLLSPAGVRFRQYLQQADQLGIQQINQQAQYAYALLERDVYQERVAGVSGDPQKNQLLNNGNRRPNANGVLVAPPGGGLPPGNENLSLREQLLQAFKQNGVSDADVDGAPSAA